ncbi:ATP11 protein [Phytophthora cactorum]|nr:ATP11 protein [Phytophthora cactorum]
MSSIGLRLGRRALLSSRHARNFASSKSGTGFSYPGARSLEQIVKLELLEGEQASKIRSIWEEFHADKDDAFQALVKRAEAAPFFIFPVYRQEGFFNMLCQFQQSCFLVTYLEAFKENPSAAPPCKELALVRADVINMLDKKESQLLLQQLLASYQDDKLYEHVDKFNNKPDQFDFEAYRLLLQDAMEA